MKATLQEIKHSETQSRTPRHRSSEDMEYLNSGGDITYLRMYRAAEEAMNTEILSLKNQLRSALQHSQSLQEQNNAYRNKLEGARHGANQEQS